MTGLLVSVRSGAEAAVALAGGADIVDVKEPRRGALGAAEPSVWWDVLRVVDGVVVTSVALGELVVEAVSEIAGEAGGFEYAKVGLSEWGSRGEERWREVRQRLAKSVVLVPVVYADARAAGWPNVSEAMKVAMALARGERSPLVLIDTFQKGQGTLLDFLSMVELEAIVSETRERGMSVALAGSLDTRAIEKLLPLEPAYIGVRGAACVGGRDGKIDLGRVKSLAEIVRGGRRKAAS